VALDFRMWVRQQIDLCAEELYKIIEAFINQADRYGDLIMPGFTHLQVAQPVTWGHHMMAYVEMFGRDLDRFLDARKRMNECPLGAAALAGTSFPIDRYHTSDALGFDRPTANSLDSTSDRDFALEFLSASAICATHLSRFSEELVIWSSSQFGFVNISERFSSGSSIMPQKKNPDAAELIRAKGSRINGSLIALLTTMKGLPLTYSKDMQEDKEQVFDAADTLLLSLAAMSGMLSELTPNKEVLEIAASKGFSTATDLADWLVKNINIPFREAHKITGQIVKIAERKGCDLPDLKLKDMQELNQLINKNIYSVLSVKNSVNSRDSYGGTSPKEVKRQIAGWKKKMSK
jgi:argininosuccinate lyase